MIRATTKMAFQKLEPTIQYRRVQREQFVWIPVEKAEENSFSGTFPGVYKINFCLARRTRDCTIPRMPRLRKPPSPAC